ncbi:MAG: hypothetical protein J3K34DRAFT_521214 [Monoraphidium minutum]|nr:MAG: hypothetical protein J3K34DRAFT_521214 [Monoraphidium minutum]
MSDRKRSKRKLGEDRDESSYACFAAAANAVSQLYTAGVRERRATAKNTLEKVLAFVLREYPNADFVPKAVLLQFLQHEYERADHPEAGVPPGAGLLPFMVGAAGGDDAGGDAEHAAGGGGGGKPPARAGSAGRAARAGSGGGACPGGGGDELQPPQYALAPPPQAGFVAQGPHVPQPQQQAPYHQHQQQFEQQQQYHHHHQQQQQYHLQEAGGNEMDTGHPGYPPHFG